MITFLARLGLSALAVPAIVWIFSLGGITIAWWLAAAIALAVVFVGDWVATAGGEVTP